MEYEVIRTNWSGDQENQRLWRKGQIVEITDWKPHPKNFKRVDGKPMEDEDEPYEDEVVSAPKPRPRGRPKGTGKAKK